jgi:hypothetical protein
MKSLLRSILPLLLIAGFAAGCEQDGPAERLGERLDDAAEEAGDRMEDAADTLEDATDR